MDKNSKKEEMARSETEHKKMHEQGIAHVHIKDLGDVDVVIKSDESEHSHGTDSHTHGEEIDTHREGHSHSHHHDPTHTKKILNRFSRAIGHMEHIKKMVENDTDCSEVLVQLAAVKSAVNNVGREILKEHLTHCIFDALEHGDNDAVQTLESALDQFMK